MSDTAASTEYKDKTTAVRVVSIGAAIGGGLLAICGVLLGVVGMGASYAGEELAMFDPGVMYGLGAVAVAVGAAYLVLGIAAATKKTWARKGMRKVNGTLMVLLFLVGVGMILKCAWGPIPEEGDPGADAFWLLFVLYLLMVLSSIPCLLLYLFYGSRNVVRTMRTMRGSEEEALAEEDSPDDGTGRAGQIIDGVGGSAKARPGIVSGIVLFAGILGVLEFLGYAAPLVDPVNFPPVSIWFGFVSYGTAGILGTLVYCVGFLYYLWRFYQLDPTGWWGCVVMSAVSLVSSVLNATILSFNELAPAMYNMDAEALMNAPADELEAMAFGYDMLAVAGVLLMLVYLVLFFLARKHFDFEGQQAPAAVS